jgi:hypothetical protein
MIDQSDTALPSDRATTQHAVVLSVDAFDPPSGQLTWKENDLITVKRARLLVTTADLALQTALRTVDHENTNRVNLAGERIAALAQEMAAMQRDMGEFGETLGQLAGSLLELNRLLEARTLRGRWRALVHWLQSLRVADALNESNVVEGDRP